ncbi:hypothetical protein PL371_00860 [Tenacibaculum maritimum]|nr:hypothetical protein [Tenacibaculum maritimum]MDB0610446.1 hypothetical protein [Tenacibaculum maritimum]
MLEQLVIPVLVTFFTALITWLFAKRKNKQVLKSMELDNEIKSATYYKGLLDDMSARLEKAIEELMQLEKRHSNLMKVNMELVQELQKFKQLNGKQA